MVDALAVMIVWFGSTAGLNDFSQSTCMTCAAKDQVCSSGCGHKKQGKAKTKEIGKEKRKIVRQSEKTKETGKGKRKIIKQRK